ncbi:hypothetical protein [Lysinibacillus sp. 54212]|uniref:hypothetical protein n=1 Tax=Lysinibacillus sp. 54212 TaxID=3119829 RepID=UPI002FC9932D
MNANELQEYVETKYKYEDKASLQVFQNVITNAEKVAGFVDVAEPEFDIKIEYENGQTQNFHLWLNEKGQKSTIMKTNNTESIYSISEELTEHFIELVHK